MYTLFLYRRKKYLTHAFLWLFWMVYQIGLFSQFDESLDYLENYLAFFAVHILLFYVHVYGVMGLLRRYRCFLYLFPILLFLEFSLYFILFVLISLLFGDVIFDGWEGELFNIENVSPFVQPFLGYIIAASLYAVLENKLTENIEWKGRALLKYIGNHFLGNYLAKIYNDLRGKDKEEAKAVLWLQKYATFLLNDGGGGPKPIGKELEAIRDLLRMEKLRRSEAFSLYLLASEDVNTVPLIPILLITLVENIFQHGIYLNPDTPAVMEISCLDKVLLVETRNKIKRTKLTTGHGMALQNLKERLDLYHHGRYNFSYREVDGDFIVALRVWE